jgi:hypothetical protein
MNCLLFGLAFGMVLVRSADAPDPAPATPDVPAAQSVENRQAIEDPLDGISLVDTTHTAAPAADSPIATTATDPEKLAAEVQRLAATRQGVTESALTAKSPDATESIHLRLKLAELLMRLSLQKKERKADAESSLPPVRRTRAAEHDATKSSARKASPNDKAVGEKSTALRPGGGEAPHAGPTVKNGRPPEQSPKNKRDAAPEGPVDPIALAQALYRTGDYEGALATYRLINPNTVDRPNRIGIQYMIATCLRKVGKKEEAATLYREVANSHDDNFLADCAKWQLSALEWRRDIEGRLETLRNKNHPAEQKR